MLIAHDEIVLTPEQLEAVGACLQKTQGLSDELRVRLERETAALAALTKQEPAEEPALIAQLDRVLDLEREVKHLRVGQGVVVKNLLTPEQQAKLRGISLEIAKNHAAFTKLEEETGRRIAAKVQRAKEGAKKWIASGRDPSPIAQAMEGKFKPLMAAEKIFEAEAELDRVLEQLTKEAK